MEIEENVKSFDSISTSLQTSSLESKDSESKFHCNYKLHSVKDNCVLYGLILHELHICFFFAVQCYDEAKTTFYVKHGDGFENKILLFCEYKRKELKFHLVEINLNTTSRTISGINL